MCFRSWTDDDNDDGDDDDNDGGDDDDEEGRNAAAAADGEMAPPGETLLWGDHGVDDALLLEVLEEVMGYNVEVLRTQLAAMNVHHRKGAHKEELQTLLVQAYVDKPAPP